MKKLTMLAMMLALVLTAAVPAVAQLANEVGQETESGDSEVATDIASEGDHASQCVAPLEFSNTGNLQNGQAFLQYQADGGPSGDGSSFSFFDEAEEGALTFTCEQPTQQSSSASS